jgi:site-specific recombinase XerD
MFEHFFKDHFRIQELREGPKAPLLEGFAQELCHMGYSEHTARRHIRTAEHLVYWADQEGVSNLTENFLKRQMKYCRCPSHNHTGRFAQSARLFLKYLRNKGLLTASDELTNQEPVLLVAFRKWMTQQRGSCEGTLYHYGLCIKDLFSSLGEDPSSYNAQSLRQFVLEMSQKSGYGKTKACTSALRMFLRFLISEGKCDDNLDAAIPVVAHWRLSSLPRYIQPEEVERVIASCDLCTPVGKRDRAILLLLARLGLRASDIVQIRLGDINWKEADIRVSGKGRCQARLPLTQEVGDAIVDYLLAGRPQTNTDALFIRACAPYRAFASHCAVSVIVAQAMCRAGVSCPSRGAAHVLRHSAATSMLRQGASLHEIAAVLRHRSIETTQIYAKVDVTALQKIAQAWPEVQPC